MGPRRQGLVLVGRREAARGGALLTPAGRRRRLRVVAKGRTHLHTAVAMA